ncbi:hypothetical protein [Microbispora sp. NPDC049125]|uniref:effector-associated constant component EACC1 n=1 Tax=Microbispora sp. NPDC049125 TaxID=3154929 RepID=UPI0034667C9C
MSDEYGNMAVSIETASRVYGRQDGAFLEQVNDLRRSLRAKGVRLTEQEEAGTKGGVDLGSTVEALIAGGAGLTALCSVVKVWLQQRGDRLARLTFRAADGAEVRATVEGRNISDETLLRFAKDVAKHLK